MFLKPTDASEVSQIIRSLQPKKSFGSDNPIPCFQKQSGEQVSLPMANLINTSLSEGIVPN